MLLVSWLMSRPLHSITLTEHIDIIYKSNFFYQQQTYKFVAKIMKSTLCMVSKFILIFLQCQTQMFHFQKKRASEYIWNGERLWQRRRWAEQRWSAGPHRALSVFIWHYYSPGNKFWHVKISDNNDIKFNQWRLLSPPRLSSAAARPADSS